MNDRPTSSAGLFLFYGLHVAIQAPLDELLTGWMPEGSAPADLHIGLASPVDRGLTSDWVETFLALDSLEDGRPEFVAKRHPPSGSICLTYHDGIAFTVNAAGTAVDIEMPPGIEVASLLPALLGPIMGVTMRQRGVVCLHASAIALGHQVIALVGDSGAGKSTTAAAFARRGDAVLGDDVLPLSRSEDTWLATPAYPKLRLWPEAAAALMGSADALPPMMPGWTKRALDLTRHNMQFQPRPLPLAAIYFLGPRQAMRSDITAIAPAEAMMRLVSDSFASRSQTALQRAAEFRFMGDLVRQIPLRQVSACDDLDQLSALCDAIEADALQLRAPLPEAQ